MADDEVTPELMAECRRYAFVLEDMLNADFLPKATFGEKLKASLAARALPPPSAAIERALLMLAFKVAGTGRLPGAPDA